MGNLYVSVASSTMKSKSEVNVPVALQRNMKFGYQLCICSTTEDNQRTYPQQLLNSHLLPHRKTCMSPLQRPIMLFTEIAGVNYKN